MSIFAAHKLVVEQKFSRHQTNQIERQGAKKTDKKEKRGVGKEKGEEVGNQKRRLARSKAIETSCVSVGGLDLNSILDAR